MKPLRAVSGGSRGSVAGGGMAAAGRTAIDPPSLLVIDADHGASPVQGALQHACQWQPSPAHGQAAAAARERRRQTSSRQACRHFNCFGRCPGDLGDAGRGMGGKISRCLPMSSKARYDTGLRTPLHLLAITPL